MMQIKKMVQKMLGINIGILLLVVISNCNFTLGQYKNRCTFSEHKISRRQTNPLLLRSDSINESLLQNKIKENGSLKRGKLFIPVVVHVLWNTPEQNISDDQIQSQIDVLNRDYNRQNFDLLPENHPFYIFGGGLDIHFFLAEQDPNNRLTTGIIRKQTSVTAWEDNDEMKSSTTAGDDYWDSRKYLNIYVVKFKDDLGLLGYAYPPSDLTAYPETDGVVIDFRAFGTTGTAGTEGFDGYALGRTTTHEVGHWLNLNHIWGDQECGDDLVKDTPIAEDQNIENPVFPWRPQNKCGSDQNGEMFMNYMDYVYDKSMNMFTKEQVKRMYNSVVQFRPELLKNDFCTDFTINVNSSYCEGTTSVLNTDRLRGQWYSTDTLIAKTSQSGTIVFLKDGPVSIGYELKQNSSCPSKKISKQVVIESKYNGNISQEKDTLKINITEGRTIQWFDCDQKELNLSNASSKSYSPVKSGNYGVVVKSKSCSDTIQCFPYLICVDTLNPMGKIPDYVCMNSEIDLSDILSKGKWLSTDTTKAIVDSLKTISFISPGVFSLTYIPDNSMNCPLKKLSKEVVIESKYNGNISQEKDTLKINVTEGRTIQWFDCDQKELNLSNASSKSYLPIKSGNYGVVVKSNSCSDTLSCFKINLLLINRLDSFMFKVYPNPANSILNIEIEDNFLNSNLEIIDNTGKIVDSLVLYPHQKQYPIKLNKGYYSLKIISKEGNSHLSRLLVE